MCQTFSALINKCPSCAFIFSEADKAWDDAIDSGRCPRCSEPLLEFPVPAKEQKGKPATIVGLIEDDKTSKAYQQATSPWGKNWKRVTAEEAKRHPLYGVRGWLALFAFSVPLDFLKAVAIVNTEALKIGMSAGKLLSVHMPSISFLKLALAIEALEIIIIYWLLFTKHQRFRPVTTCVLLGLWPTIALVGIMNPFPELGNMLGVSFFQWAIGCTVWVTYLQRSKRVRVTFEHTVKVAQQLETSNIDRSISPSCERPINDASRETSARANSPGITKAVPSSQPPTKPIVPGSIAAKSSQETKALEDRLYEQIAQELETNTVEKGLWTKAFAQAGGDDKQTRILYIKSRFDRLIAMENARLEAIRMAPILEREKRVKQCESLLSSKGYKLIPKDDGWVVKEPLGGRQLLKTLEELEQYANSRQEP